METKHYVFRAPKQRMSTAFLKFRKIASCAFSALDNAGWVLHFWDSKRSAVFLGLENGGSVGCFQPLELKLRGGALGWRKTEGSGEEGVGVWAGREGVGQGVWAPAGGGVRLCWFPKLGRLSCTRPN